MTEKNESGWDSVDPSELGLTEFDLKPVTKEPLPEEGDVDVDFSKLEDFIGANPDSSAPENLIRNIMNGKPIDPIKVKANSEGKIVFKSAIDSIVVEGDKVTIKFK